MKNPARFSTKSRPTKKAPTTSSRTPDTQSKTERPSLQGSPWSPATRHKKPEKIYAFADADARIYDAFRHHDFGDYPHEKRRQLTHFYELLMQHQMGDNVTRLVKIRDIAIKHFIDSLLVTRLTQLQFPLLDVGTGPGFPGIPLKIHYPDKKIILAEGVRRRVDFLKVVREKLELKELDILGRYINKDFVYPVAGVITRAVEDVGLTLENVSHCLQKGGKVYLMKGPNVDDEIAKAKKNWSHLYRLTEDHAYEIAKTPHQRRLVVFEKMNSVEPL